MLHEEWFVGMAPIVGKVGDTILGGSDKQIVIALGYLRTYVEAWGGWAAAMERGDRDDAMTFAVAAEDLAGMMIRELAEA